ncbi:Protein CHUP1, chloroplastic [Glycine soja]
MTCEKSSQNENVHTNPNFKDTTPKKDKPAAIVSSALPPRPSPTLLLPLHKIEKGLKVQPAIAPPPPPTPQKLSSVGLKTVRCVPEDANMENRIYSNGIPIIAFTRNMIKEVENRLTYYLSGIKSEVQRQGEFISSLIKEVESTCFVDVYEVEAFVKWLHGELSSLVDERQSKRVIDSNFEKDTSTARQASMFETSVSYVDWMRESTSKRYRNFHIRWEWMLDIVIIDQMKLSSLKLTKEFMKQITKELVSNELLQEDNLFVQGVKFAFKVHQVEYIPQTSLS